MRFGDRFSTLSFKAALLLGLLGGLSFLPTAAALSFFGGKKKVKAPVESIPPIIQHQPSLMRPAYEPAPKDAKPELTKPEAMGPIPIVQPADPVKALIDSTVYPPAWNERIDPLSRAELADVLVKALKHNTKLVSEFPFYRDVPKDYWAYNTVETARAKKLLDYPNDHGFYYPEKLVTFSEVFTGIAHAITGPPPSDEETSFYLVIYPDWEDIPAELQPAVAKMTRSRFFEGQLSPGLQLSEPATPKAIAPYIITLTHLNERRTVLPPQKEALLPTVPGGLTLKISPTIAIFEARMGIGETVYFSLIEAVGPLPKGTKLKGTVIDMIRPHSYVVELTEAEPPEEGLYRLNADMNIVFTKKSLPFVVPGESFQAITRTPSSAPVVGPIKKNGPVPVKPVPPPSPPAASSGSKAVPNSVPRSSKSPESAP